MGKELTARIAQFLKLLVKSCSNLNIQLARWISLQPFNSDFFLFLYQLTLRPFYRMCGRYTLFNPSYLRLYIYIYIYIFISLSLKSFWCYIWRETIRCNQIKLLLISTFPRSWIEIQQQIISISSESLHLSLWF